MKDWLVKIALIDDVSGKKTNDCVIIRNAEFVEIGKVVAGNYPLRDYEILSATQYSADYIGDRFSEKHFEFVYALTTIDEVTAKEKKVKSKVVVSADTFDQAKEIYDKWQKETVSDVELVRTKELKVSEIYG